MNVTDRIANELVRTITEDYKEKHKVETKSFFEYFNITEESLVEDLKAKLNIIIEAVIQVFPNSRRAPVKVRVYVGNSCISTFEMASLKRGQGDMLDVVYLENIYPEQANAYIDYVKTNGILEDNLNRQIRELEKNVNSAIACCATVKDFKTHFKKYGEILTSIQNKYKEIYGESNEV